jgi:phenylpropionate dioxygenase-like ring-hydroxylating dioxygenase large terminal subunit
MTRSFAGHPALRRYWHPVVRAADLGDGPLGVELLQSATVLWRSGDGQVHAALDRCPHREAPLSLGAVRAGQLQCAYHGWTFDGDGRCALVPSSGPGAAIPPRARLDLVHVAERYGLVWVCLDEPVAGIPEMPEDGDPSFRRIALPVEHWTASATRMVDNFLDISHFPYVHQGSFGGAGDPLVPKIELGELGGDFYGYRYSVTAANAAGGAAAASGQATGTVTREMSTGFYLPFAVHSAIDYDTGLRHSMLLVTTPVDDARSLFAFVVWRNDDFSVPADEVTRLDRMIGAEDKAMLERIPGSLPLESTGVVNVQSDKASVEWRRQLRSFLS